MVHMPPDIDSSPEFIPHESADILTAPNFIPTVTRRLPTLPRFSFTRPPDGVSMPSVNKVIHTYNLTVGEIDIRLFITIEPVRELSREHTFFLTMKVGTLERPISEPTTLRLTVDPRSLEFVVFAYPPRACLPQGCLYSLRVWLRSGDIDHRLFSEDALWIGSNPDFSSVQDAAFARLRNVTSHMLLYKIAIGTALMDFVIRYREIFERVYSLSLEYDGCGVGRILLDDFVVGLDCPLEDLGFVIYTIPVSSVPWGATHRIRLWIRVPTPSVSMPSPSADTSSSRFIYHRIWSTDSFKVGNCLDFTALGPKLVMGVSDGDGPKTVHSPSEQLFHREGRPADVKRPIYGAPTGSRKEVL